jgi:hypothetical protein
MYFFLPMNRARWMSVLWSRKQGIRNFHQRSYITTFASVYRSDIHIYALSLNFARKSKSPGG